MGRLPHIPDVDIPRAVLELADLSDVHPAPIFPDLDFVVRAYPDRSSCLPQHRPFSRSNNPCTEPLPTRRPHAHVHHVPPVIDDLNGTTWLLVVLYRSRLPIGDLGDREER